MHWSPKFELFIFLEHPKYLLSTSLVTAIDLLLDSQVKMPWYPNHWLWSQTVKENVRQCSARAVLWTSVAQMGSDWLCWILCERVCTCVHVCACVYRNKRWFQTWVLSHSPGQSWWGISEDGNTGLLKGTQVEYDILCSSIYK